KNWGGDLQERAAELLNNHGWADPRPVEADNLMAQLDNYLFNEYLKKDAKERLWMPVEAPNQGNNFLVTVLEAPTPRVGESDEAYVARRLAWETLHGKAWWTGFGVTLKNVAWTASNLAVIGSNAFNVYLNAMGINETKDLL